MNGSPSIFQQFALGVSSAFGAPAEGTGVGLAPSPHVIQGPVKLGPGQTALPFTQLLGVGTNKQGLPTTLVSASPYFRSLGVSTAAGEFFSPEPGGEVVSSFPGAADLLRSLQAGFLPTLREPGAQASVADSGAPLGGSMAVAGGVPLGTIALAGTALLAVALLLRGRRR